MTTLAPDTTEDLRWVSEIATKLPGAVDRICAGRSAGQVSPEDMTALVAAAAKLFSDRTDRDGTTALNASADRLSATEAVVLIKALMEATDINLFDLAIWYRRVG